MFPEASQRVCDIRIPGSNLFACNTINDSQFQGRRARARRLSGLPNHFGTLAVSYRKGKVTISASPVLLEIRKMVCGGGSSRLSRAVFVDPAVISIFV